MIDILLLVYIGVVVELIIALLAFAVRRNKNQLIFVCLLGLVFGGVYISKNINYYRDNPEISNFNSGPPLSNIPAVTSPAPQTNHQPAEVTGRLNIFTAYQLLFGEEVILENDGDDSSVVSVIWAPSEEIGRLLNFEDQANLVETRIILIRENWNNDPNQVLILTETAPPNNTCHACTTALGGAIVAWENGSWKFLTNQILITQLGTYGQLPDFQVTDIGPGKQGVIFYETYSQHGYLFNWNVIITDVDGYLKKVLQFDTYEDNFGFCGPDGVECYQFTASYDLIPGSNPDYYDFRVTESGTKILDEAVMNASGVKLFSFSGTEYRELGQE